MKLSVVQIERVSAATGVDPIPDDFPAMTDLREVFGDHTFYLSQEGLLIWESLREDDNAVEGNPVVAVKLAGWSDEPKTTLAPQQPEVIDVVIDLSGEEPGPAK